MFWISTIVALLLGILGAANMIVGKKPEAQDFINKIGPFQGILGVIGLVLGVMGILNSLSPFMLIPLIGSAVFAALGLIFALDLIKSVTGSSALDSLAAKLMPFKGLMGLVLIGLTAYGLVMYITA